MHLAHTILIQLPVGDRLAIGTPAIAIAQAQFLLVHPVECAINDCTARRLCHRVDTTILQVLDVNIALTHIGYKITISRRKLGEHQCGRLGLSSDFLQLATGAIQHPVVTTRVAPPNALGIRID